MRKVILGLGAAVSLVALTAAAYATAGYRLFEHNGSTMKVVRGMSTVVSYHNPRPELRDYGIRSGSELFSGREDTDGRLTGNAFYYSKSCGPVEYEVSGAWSQNDRSLTLTGPVPVLDRNCQVDHYSTTSANARLDFYCIGRCEERFR